MMYVLGIMALITALTAGWGTWEHHSKVAAEAQVEELQTKVDAQNAAIKATKEEGDKRVAAATNGIIVATKTTKAAQDEAARLRALQMGATPAGPCPAGSAASEIRKGLAK